MNKFLQNVLLLSLVSAVFPAQVAAHGGEDHSHDEAPQVQVSGDKPSRLTDGSLFIPKAAQHQWQLRTRKVQQAEHQRSVELQAEVVLDPAFGGLIEAGQLGQLQAGPDGWPTLGQQVRAGQVLAAIAPLDTSLDRSNQQALLAELDAQIALTQDRIRRFEKLGTLMPANELDALNIDLAGLKKRREFAAKGAGQLVPVVAPVSGVISQVHKLRGQVVESQDALFQIVDPSELFIAARLYDTSLTLPANPGASARLLAGDNTNSGFPLQFQGQGLQLQQQARPLWFKALPKAASTTASNTENTTPQLSVGQQLTVVLSTGEVLKGWAVPRTALQKLDTGETAVWVHQSAERFIAQKVSPLPLNSEEVVIVSGLHDGDRVVVQAASLLAQVR
ncbi:efflux RND transporter periplasmic adaptor subunit [Rheinheimera sp. 4Y26]|uniref:efflux RND transporter periplasmic adaptor subunit n=1 Tax=Rheinheimera sp. 4Y26 TaxID=2977811 RepID=UPI0021B15118|nr:HlyD family efflux transporter periplasmic adaptor subunit [Rheinheimera sp. 4Y26]MCT6701036.1 HlyD family efflux transporter periplasmic adaptor subunit [Rheinheimera sp. 4Y26]